MFVEISAAMKMRKRQIDLMSETPRTYPGSDPLFIGTTSFAMSAVNGARRRQRVVENAHVFSQALIDFLNVKLI